MRLSFGSLLLVTLIVAGSSCKSVLPPRVPVEVYETKASAVPVAQSRLVVMLPGRHSRGSHFDREGISQEIANALGTDVVAVDLHFGYYRTRTFLQRLREDVILPARQRGYREIHLLGVSMGGMGALFYAAEYPEDIDALALFSPFVGDPEILEEIQAAGGVSAWIPGDIAESDYQRRLWALLKRFGARDKEPQIWVACGKGDPLFDSNAYLVSQILPGEGSSFVTIDGEHDWAAWRRMTSRYRDRLETR